MSPLVISEVFVRQKEQKVNSKSTFSTARFHFHSPAQEANICVVLSLSNLTPR
jgi:hypothetical protein